MSLYLSLTTRTTTKITSSKNKCSDPPTASSQLCNLQPHRSQPQATRQRQVLREKTNLSHQNPHQNLRSQPHRKPQPPPPDPRHPHANHRQSMPCKNRHHPHNPRRRRAWSSPRHRHHETDRRRTHSGQNLLEPGLWGHGRGVQTRYAQRALPRGCTNDLSNTRVLDIILSDLSCKSSTRRPIPSHRPCPPRLFPRPSPPRHDYQLSNPHNPLPIPNNESKHQTTQPHSLRTPLKPPLQHPSPGPQLHRARNRLRLRLRARRSHRTVSSAA